MILEAGTADILPGYSRLRDRPDERAAGRRRAEALGFDEPARDPLEAFFAELYVRQGVFGVGVDDSHHYHEMAIGKSNPGRGWVMVRARHRPPALRAAHRCLPCLPYAACRARGRSRDRGTRS